VHVAPVGISTWCLHTPHITYFCAVFRPSIATGLEINRKMRAFVVEHAAVPDTDERKPIGVLKTSEPQPVPKIGEALIRVLRAGVCNTDLELLAG